MYVIAPHCGFNFNVPSDMIVNIFYVLICRQYVLFGEVSAKSFARLFYWVICFLITEFLKFFECVDYKSFIRYLICKHCLLFVWALSFRSVSQGAEVLNFDKVQFFKFFFLGRFILLVSFYEIFA